MAAPIRFMGLHIHHPAARERLNGGQSRVTIGVIVGKSDVVRDIPLEEHDLLNLIADAAQYLKTLRRVP